MTDGGSFGSHREGEDHPEIAAFTETPGDGAARPPRLGRVLVAALAVVVVAAAVAAVVVVRRDDTPDAATLFARAARHLEQAGTYAFRGDMRFEERDGSSRFTHRVALRGAAALPDRSRMQVVDSDSATEVIAIGEVAYIRVAADEDRLKDRQWGRFDADEAAGIIFVEPDVETAGAGDALGLLNALRAVESPELVRRSNGLSVVRTDVDVEKAFGRVAAQSIDDVSLEITAGNDGRIERAVSVVAAEGVTVRLDVRLSGWGAPVDIDAPGDDEIDPTPGIEEEDVAGYQDATLYDLRRVPMGWVRDGAEVLEAEDTPEDCRQVLLSYTDPEDPEEGYLVLYQMPVECAPRQPRAAQPFTAGNHRGYVELDDEGILVTVTVNRTLIQVDTDLDPDELRPLLADLVPLDLDREPGHAPRRGGA